jgi:membrane-bound lytic murein transglycosylase D
MKWWITKLVMLSALIPVLQVRAEKPVRSTAITPIIVPEKMTFCGINLSLTPKCQAEIQKRVNSLTKNPLYHQIHIDRAAIYMPYVEEAFRLVNVPDDLKYIVIQESGLVGDAVSTSNAVGFWQFKDFSAREVGLRIDALVDERKHIFRSSVGAARYFRKQYDRHPNWLYAVIAYYTGGTGAIPYINEEKYYAKEMIIDETLHFYALKALAHKLAFENHIKQNSPIWLEALPADNYLTIDDIAKKHNLTITEFKKYNLWALGSRLPEDRKFSYYLSHSGKAVRSFTDPLAQYFLDITDESKLLLATAEQDALAQPGSPVCPPRKNGEKNKKTTTEITYTAYEDYKAPKINRPEPLTFGLDSIIIRDVEQEPYYRTEMIYFTGEISFQEIIKASGKSEKKIRKWNNLNGQDPAIGQLIWLVPPAKAHIHIAKAFETLEEIAQLHEKSAEKLQMLNHFAYAKNEPLKEGQKIYLRESRPVNEPIIILRKIKPTPDKIAGNSSQKDNNRQAIINANFPDENGKPANKNELTSDSLISTPVGKDVFIPDPNSEQSKKTGFPILPDDDANRQYDAKKEHIVREGETLTDIAQKYAVSEQTLRTLNKLKSDKLKTGKRLRIRE